MSSLCQCIAKSTNLQCRNVARSDGLCATHNRYGCEHRISIIQQIEPVPLASMVHRKQKSDQKKQKQEVPRIAKKPSRGCVKQTQKKYTDRPSPPYPANECCGEIMQGNDGNRYISVADIRGICRWKPYKSS